MEEMRSEDKTTFWAHERTLLARERTFAAWIRTALGLIGLSIASVKMTDGFRPPWLVPMIGITLLVCGIAIHLSAYWRYLATFRTLREMDGRRLPPWTFTSLNAIALLGELGVGVLFFAR